MHADGGKKNKTTGTTPGPGPVQVLVPGTTCTVICNNPPKFLSYFKSERKSPTQKNYWLQCPSGLSVICSQKILLTECLEQGGEESSHQWSRLIISPNSDFWTALTEHEWNWIQLLIWIVFTVMVIDYCHGYMNAWMYGSWSSLPCSNLIQAKE